MVVIRNDKEYRVDQLSDGEKCTLALLGDIARRVAMANPKTGGVDLDEILSKIDKDTLLLSVMSASNISGYIFDIETIVREARKINPDIYILSDAVQHAPHGVLDVEQCGLDGVTFAPYKMFGIRGCGYGYVSDRVAKMTHHKLLAKPEKEWELGTFPHPNYAAITAVVDYVCWIGRHFTDSDDRREQFVTGMTRIHLQEHSLLIHMMEGTDEVPGLRHIPGVQVFLDSADTVDRDLISAIGINGIDFTQLTAEYYNRGITVFERVNTSLYSKRIVESLGLTGAIRVRAYIDGELTEFTEFVPLGGSRYLLYTATDKAIVEYIEGEITALWHAHRISEPAQGLFPGDMRLMSLAEQDFFPGEGASFSGTDWITGDADAQYVITLQNGEMVYTGKISQDLVDQDGNRTGIVWQDIAPITLLA